MCGLYRHYTVMCQWPTERRVFWCGRATLAGHDKGVHGALTEPFPTIAV
ncbi:hypothetical protein BN2497_7705 [Janthinobacterium sp. CG23_2]|nr:hypothetical protein BN2497_7705 [Janthinobacterium sp. CG23_2]CUU30250.1 hypothetical protein BN3177_7705 [Janthinobacterium sp. CG23_2]